MTSADVLPFRGVRDPDEVATIVAGNNKFDDWKSVYVQHRWADAWAWFRFTSAERESDPRRLIGRRCG
jgi:hypothetical protein